MTSIPGLAFRGLAALAVLTASVSAQAALLRGSGGAYSQDTFIYYVSLMDDSNFVSDQNLAMDLNAYDARRTISSANHLVYATPPNDCYRNVEYTEENRDGVHTACTWEFAQGEAIHLNGAVTGYLPGTIYELVWTITGNGKTWSFGGDEVTFDGDGVGDDEVFLDVLMPDDMGVGDYAISLLFRQWAREGKKLFQRDDESYSPSQYECLDYEATQCGYAGVIPVFEAAGPYGRDYAGFRVVAAVPEPGSLSLLGVGLAALGLSRRRGRRQP